MKVSLNTEIKKLKIADDAKILRISLCEADIEVHGVVWQIDTTSRDYIKDVLSASAESSVDSIDWILADNVVRSTTALELKEVLNAYTERLAVVFDNYRKWRNSAMTKPFTNV